MLNKWLKSYSILLLFLFLSINIETTYSRDITEKVVSETNVDNRIEDFCNEYCQGNKRRGYLKSMTLNQIDSNKYNVVSRVALQSKEIYRDIIIYDHTVLINTFGTLNTDNCELKVNDIFVQNDFKNIFTNLIKEQTDLIGRKEIIDDCEKFVN